MSSFDQYPDIGGITGDGQPGDHHGDAVTRIGLRSPPILRMSCSSAMAWITDPAARKSSALKKAWVMRWKRPAA